jgi:hypothetical protein
MLLVDIVLLRRIFHFVAETSVERRRESQAVLIIGDASDEPQAELFFKSALRNRCLN